MRRFLIGGNWKMQVNQVGEAEKIAEQISTAIDNIDLVDVFIAPPFTALYQVNRALSKTNLKLAAQNMHYVDKGAFTGQISVDSLIDCGCDYVILGHSEPRRIFGEKNETINLKVLKALEKGLKVVLCVGETAKERLEDKVTSVNHQQLSGCLKDVSENQLTNIIIAYEPVWAINNPYLNPDTEIKPATPEQAEEAHIIIRKWFKENYGLEASNEIRIIYGGSMNAKNAKQLLEIEDIDGGLIGSASLSVDKLYPIIRIAQDISEKNRDYKWVDNTLKFEKK
ncbi:MAG: triose-phosphate isomerase [Candidatus Hodarchaeales archaeon]